MAHAGDPPAGLIEDNYSQSHRNSGASFSQAGGLLVMNNPQCFFEVSADGENIGRMVFELREDLVPKTVKNFKKLCEGFDNKCFKLSIFHRIIPGFMCQVRRHLSSRSMRDDQLVGGAVCVCRGSVCVCVAVVCVCVCTVVSDCT